METHVKNSVAAHDSLKLMSKFVSQLKKKLREIQELETKLHEKHKNLVQAQKVSLKREVSIAITKTGQQQIQTITGLKATFTKRNEHLVKEYGTALEKRIIGVLDDTEERVWSQVEQLASDQLESVTQIEQLKEEINEQSLELSILRHRVRHIEGLFALYYRGRRLCDAIAKAIMASVCAAITLTIIISFIAWLGFPLAFQIFIFLLLLCSPAGFIVFLR